jgi:hypothetical protein
VARLYINGQRAGTGATPYPLSVVDDRNNWLGRSQWVDPMYNGLIDEFRIYNGPALDADIAADFAAGPNALPVARPTLSFSRSGSNLIISWPTNGNDGYVLQSSGVMAIGTTWSNVTGTPTISGANYQMTVPTSGEQQYYKLTK